MNATDSLSGVCPSLARFQWAPTLGGECYVREAAFDNLQVLPFQWAPTLGGECYTRFFAFLRFTRDIGFSGHPPLGVNATSQKRSGFCCEQPGFNGHPPLGVNATVR